MAQLCLKKSKKSTEKARLGRFFLFKVQWKPSLRKGSEAGSLTEGLGLLRQMLTLVMYSWGEGWEGTGEGGGVLEKSGGAFLGETCLKKKIKRNIDKILVPP